MLKGMWMLIYTLAKVVTLTVLTVVVTIAIWIRSRKKRKDATTFGFLHPYASSGGGGERVLWCAVKSISEAMRKANMSCEIVIYTGDSESKKDTLRAVKNAFNLDIPENSSEFSLRFVRIHTRAWIEASRYPMFTLLGQSFGSMILTLDALSRYRPHVFVDTTGYAFSYPIARWISGCKVVSYTHYPTISTDMFDVVKSRKAQFNNNALVASSSVRTQAKLFYYRVFAALYSWAGRRADIVMVNSSWTRGHVNELFRIPKRTHLVYPPCDTTALQRLSIDKPRVNPRIVLSVAQFRPEKNHALQLRAFKRMLKQDQKNEFEDVELHMVGSCRNKGDRDRQKELEQLRDELGLDRSRVIFHVNAPYPDLVKLLERATIGLHTMRDEHFGIVVVEMMASGAVPIAHDSAGPEMDIIGCFNPAPGFLASNEKEYADMLSHALQIDLQPIRRLGRERAKRFSQESFQERWWNAISDVVVR